MLGCASNEVKVEPAPLPELESPIKIAVQWKNDVGRGMGGKYVRLQPAFANDLVFMADVKGLMAAYDVESGKRRWRIKTKEQISGGVAAYGDRVWYGALSGELVCLSASDGSELWRRALGSELLAPVTVDGSLVVAQTSDGKVFGLSEANGHQQWVYETVVPILSLRGTSRPQAASGAIIAAFASGKLVALNRETGFPIWDRQIAVPRGRSELEKMVDLDGGFVIESDTLYVASFQGRVAALELYSGQIKWQKEMSSYTGLALGPAALYLSDSEGVMWALDRETGATVWKQDGLLARALTGPQYYNESQHNKEYVVVGDYEGYLHWLAAKSGEFVGRVKIDRKGLRGQPFEQLGSLFVSGVGGQLARVEPK